MIEVAKTTNACDVGIRQSLRVGIVILIVLGGAAHAQELPARTNLEEILVTAQKRPQSLQDIPIAISAISGRELAELGLTISRELESVVPNMRWVGTDGTAVSEIFIRGVGDDSFHLNQVGGVGMNVDEVGLNSPILSMMSMFDLQRVEVLRGPQNTLFGHNTTGGAVQFVSRKPNLADGLSGLAAVTAGNFGRLNVEAAANLPLQERLAARLSVSRFAQGDTFKNAFLNKTEGGFQRTAGRIHLLWRASDSIDALFSAHGGEFRGSVARYKEIGLGTPGNPAAAHCPANLVKATPGNGCVDQTSFADTANYNEISDNGVNFFATNTRGGSARLDWRLPSFTLTSVTAFEHADARRAEDSTGGPSYIFDLMQSSNTNQWSEELRAVSQDQASLHWIGGLYFLDERALWSTVPVRANPVLTPVAVPGRPVPAAGFAAFDPFTLANQRDTVISAYGQLEFKLSGRMRLTTGLRFTSEEKIGVVKDGIATTTRPTDPTLFVAADEINTLLVGGTQVAAGLALRQVCAKPLALKQCYAITPFDIRNNSVGGKVSLDYSAGDGLLAYGSISRGFKAGGVSIGALDYLARGGSTVSPEHLMSYELGLKVQAFDSRLRINAALFDNQWTDEQLFLSLNTPGTGLNPVYVNVPRTESHGVEVELEWIPARTWFVQTAIGVLHSSVKTISQPLAASNGALVGSTLIAAPQLTWNALVRKEWTLGPGRVSVAGDWSYTSSQHYDLVNSPDQLEPAYWLVNARAAYSFGAKHPYEVAFWAKNLTATQYCVQRSSLGGIPNGNTAVCVPNQARKFVGLTLSGSF